jgi:hypothetical protein
MKLSVSQRYLLAKLNEGGYLTYEFRTNHTDLCSASGVWSSILPATYTCLLTLGAIEIRSQDAYGAEAVISAAGKSALLALESRRSVSAVQSLIDTSHMYPGMQEYQDAMNCGECGRCGQRILSGEGTEIYFPDSSPMLIHAEGCALNGDVNDMCLVYRNGSWENQ